MREPQKNQQNRFCNPPAPPTNDDPHRLEVLDVVGKGSAIRPADAQPSTGSGHSTRYEGITEACQHPSHLHGA